jgi:hypothetical protein
MDADRTPSCAKPPWPAQRCRGGQAALLSARLTDAAAGCAVAVIVTQSRSISQQNSQHRVLTYSTPALCW